MVDQVMADYAVLDNPAWASMSGPHASLVKRNGRAARYLTDIAAFASLADPDDPAAWADLTALVEPGEQIAVPGATWAPAAWTGVELLHGVQLVDTALRAERDPEAVPLGPADVPEMLDLVRRTEPGPFLPRTIELGGYVGIRRGGALVAMAGERLHPPGWTEISAVCTDPAHRGQGLASRLVRTVAAGIRAGGDVPFLHTTATNTNAIRLYESIGFTLRRQTDFLLLRAPLS